MIFGGDIQSFHHLHQISQRLCLYLFHGAAAMNLYGVFRASDLRRNLLVEHAGDNQRDYLALSWRERFAARSQRRNFRFSLASGAVPPTLAELRPAGPDRGTAW